MTEQKNKLRREIKERRDSLPIDGKKAADAAIIERIAASEAFLAAGAILLYAPHGSEINLLPLVRTARREGKLVAFPRCNTETHTMQFLILSPEARLTPGAYGIPEPPTDAPICPMDETTLCILPGLTFDPTGARLGYGAGYYDRFLTDFPGVRAGAVYENLAVREVPTEPHDIPIELLFTETRTHVCAKMPIPVKKESEEKPKAPASSHRITWGLHAPPILASACLLLLLLSRLIDTALTNRSNEYLVVILLQLLIFAVPAILYAKLRGEKFIERIRMRPIGRRHWWFLLCMSVVMITGGLLLCILTGGISSLTGNFTLYDTFVARINNSSPMQTLYVILAYCLLPAFCEELIYRAFLCAEYERYGAPVAITVSALFFAMLHLSFPLFPAYLFLGAILACIMYTARSFFAAFLLHAVYNLFCLFGQPYLSTFYVRAGSNEIFIFCVGTVFLLFSAFACGEARRIYHRYAREGADASYVVPTPRKEFPKRLWQALLSPAAAVCMVIFLIAAILRI